MRTSTLALAAFLVFAGCAQGSKNTSVGGGSGGNGNGGSGASTGGGDGGQGNTGNTMQGGVGGSGDGGSGNTGNTGNNGGSGGSGASGASGGSGGQMCPAGKHYCGGICVGNTPATGCFTSVTCDPCPAPPSGGTTVCDAAGMCDFTCSAPYMKQGNACVCSQQCCSNADCPNGGTCSGGVCMQPPPMCDANDCQAQCILMCFPGFGIGMCGAAGCQCLCVM